MICLNKKHVIIFTCLLFSSIHYCKNSTISTTNQTNSINSNLSLSPISQQDDILSGVPTPSNLPQQQILSGVATPSNLPQTDTNLDNDQNNDFASSEEEQSNDDNKTAKNLAIAAGIAGGLYVGGKKLLGGKKSTQQKITSTDSYSQSLDSQSKVINKLANTDRGFTMQDAKNIASFVNDSDNNSDLILKSRSNKNLKEQGKTQPLNMNNRSNQNQQYQSQNNSQYNYPQEEKIQKENNFKNYTNVPQQYNNNTLYESQKNQQFENRYNQQNTTQFQEQQPQTINSNQLKEKNIDSLGLDTSTKKIQYPTLDAIPQQQYTQQEIEEMAKKAKQYDIEKNNLSKQNNNLSNLSDEEFGKKISNQGGFSINKPREKGVLEKLGEHVGKVSKLVKNGYDSAGKSLQGTYNKLTDRASDFSRRFGNATSELSGKADLNRKIAQRLGHTHTEENFSHNEYHKMNINEMR